MSAYYIARNYCSSLHIYFVYYIFFVYYDFSHYLCRIRFFHQTLILKFFFVNFPTIQLPHSVFFCRLFFFSHHLLYIPCFITKMYIYASIINKQQKNSILLAIPFFDENPILHAVPFVCKYFCFCVTHGAHHMTQRKTWNFFLILY